MSVEHTNANDFLKISDHFPKIFQNCGEDKTNVSKHFPDIFRRLSKFPKITEDLRGGINNVLIIQQHI